MKTVLCSIFLISFIFPISGLASSLDKNSQKILESKNQKFVKNQLGNKSFKIKSLESSYKKDFLKKRCNKSGRDLIHSQSYRFNALSFYSKFNKWVDRSFSVIKKDIGEKCPSYCKQNNKYEVSSKIYPTSITQGSCKKKYSRESYSSKKKFLFKKKNKKSMEKAHKNMAKWVISTFVYPYYSIPFLSQSRESILMDISKACPPCSLYFDYNYKIKPDGHLALDIKASCGDSKTSLSDFKADFTLFNSWSCENPENTALLKKY